MAQHCWLGPWKPLAPSAGEVIVVTNSPQAHAHPAARLVGDLLPGMGSLGGIYSGLMAATTQYSLVVGCDMPFLNPKVIAYLASLAPGVDVIMPRRHKLLEPLHSIYSKPCLPFIKDLLDRRQLRIFDFLPHVRVRYVEESELTPWDPDHRSFLNINTPWTWPRCGPCLKETHDTSRVRCRQVGRWKDHPA